MSCKCCKCKFLHSIEQSINFLQRELEMLDAQEPTINVLTFYVKIFQLQNANNHIQKLLEDWKMYETMINNLDTKKPF